jgi:hypothetical protein
MVLKWLTCKSVKLTSLCKLFVLLINLHRLKISTVYSCSWPIHTTCEQDVIDMIIPNPFIFHYFVWDCKFWFTPTFWRTELGVKKGYLHRNSLWLFRAGFLPSDGRQYCGSLLWNCRGFRPVICASDGHSLSRALSLSLSHSHSLLRQPLPHSGGVLHRVQFSASSFSF